MGGIDRNVVMLGWVSFFTDMASAMVNPILPIFVVSVLHQGIDKLGIVVAVATFVSYALRLLSGYVSDRYGVVKPLVVGGYALSALSKPLIGFTHDYRGVAALKALERLGKALRSAPKDAMIAHYGQKRAGRTFGFHKTMDIGGETVGTLLLFGLLWWLGQSEGVMRGIFYATLLPGLLGLAILVWGVRDIPVAPKRTESLRLGPADYRVVRSLLFYFLFLFFFFNEAFFTMEAKGVGIATAAIPLLFLLSTALQTATSYLFGVWVDRFGIDRVMGAAYLLGAAAQGALYLRTPATTWAGFALMGLFTVASLNANRAYIAAHARNRGSVYGIFYAGIALFGATGALLAGWVWERYGMEVSLGLSFGGTALLAALYPFIGRGRGDAAGQ
ncbi:MFS transporter [Hydrogenimonas sp.]